MFTYLHVKNFKSLVDFTIDFRNKRNTPRKLNIIYGENGAGKSNIVEIFDFIKRILFSRVLTPSPHIEDENQELSKFYNLIINPHLISNIIKDYKTIEYDDNIHIECGIKLGKTHYEYIIQTDSERIIFEKLSMLKNKKDEVLFELHIDHCNIEKVSKNMTYFKELSNEIDKYWGKHAFISIILYEMHDKMVEYITKNINNNILDTIKLFLTFNVLKPINKYGINRTSFNNPLFLDNINMGNIELDKLDLLHTTEKILDSIITSLYSDIRQVYYDTKTEKDEIKYMLYCKKLIGNKLIDIPFSRESTGTQKLFDLIPLFIYSLDGGIVIIDEFDTGIHDIMIKTLLENFAENINGQLILTTHSTTLMEANIKKDSIYILDILSNRNKEVYSVIDYEQKLHPYLNIRKRYLSGEYGGIPYTSDIDFIEINEILDNAKKNNNEKNQ